MPISGHPPLLLLEGDPNALSGVLFQSTPAFPQGQVSYEQGLTGTTFVKAPTFFVGSAGLDNLIVGAEFTLAPSFFVGEITGADLTLQGVEFTLAPTFPTGEVTGGASDLTGNPVQFAPSFFGGLVFAAGAGGEVVSPSDEGLRFEVFTLPQLGSFTRKYDLSRYVNSYTVSDKFSEISDGTLTLADELPADKLDQLISVDRVNHANDEGSVIRVLRGTTPLMHYVTKQYDDTWSSDDPTARLHLEGMELLLDRAIVPRKDYPTMPSVEPDWLYGAQSILTNTDFDNPGVASSVESLEINATGGTFKIGTSYPNGDPFVYTANIPYNATAQNIADAIEAAGDITDVFVTGAGTTSNPFVIEVLDPPSANITWVTDSALLTGLASFFTETAGGNLATEPWTRSINPTSGVLHGSYTTFQITDEQFHSAPYSLKVDGDPPATTGAFPGAQQLLSVTGGRTYRAAVWVRPTQTGPFRFVIRTRDETFIAQNEQTLAANQWHELAIPSVVVPSHVSQVIFRIATISNGDEPAWYVDDALFAPGVEAATYGAIMSDVTDPIYANGVLTWLTRTWTDTHDSSGVPWDRELEWGVKRGQTILQLMEYAKRWNYEWRIRWDNVDLRFEWDLFNPTTGGTDHTGTGLAITGRSGVSSSGVIARRFPESSYYLAEGDLGQWGEDEDLAMSGAWGRLEQYFANAQGLDAEGLEELASRLVDESVGRTDGLSLRLQQPTALPWDKFNPADKLTINMLPQRAAEVMRCMAVVASQGERDSTPAYDTHWGSVVYQGEAAVLQTLRILWREFKLLQTTQASRETIVNPVIPTEPPPRPSGASTAIIIAAVDTHDHLKALADYICTGTNDQDTIEQALVDLDLTFDDAIGERGEIIFLSGNYYFDDNVFFNQDVIGKLTFKGEGTPIFHLRHSNVVAGVVAPLFLCEGSSLASLEQIRFVNIHFEGGNRTQSAVFFERGLGVKPLMIVESCIFTAWTDFLWWSERGIRRVFRNNWVRDCALTSAFHMQGFTQGPAMVTSNIWDGCSGNMISGGAVAGTTLVHGNNQFGGTMVLNAVSLVTYADNVGF